MATKGVFSGKGKVDLAPRNATTVILLRPGEPEGLEAVLQKRGRGNQFMAGAYVFPGGKVDREDGAPAMLERLPPGAVERCHARLDPTPGTDLTPDVAASLCVAGCRETFEEAGVLLARHRGGDPVDFQDERVQERFATWRQRLCSEDAAFVQMLEAEDLEVCIDDLHYWAHWITPSAEKRRFDTRFFVAMLPDGQAAESDGTEATDLVWHGAKQALHAHETGALFLPPPTQRNLQELADFVDFEQIAQESAQRNVGAILPKLALDDGHIAILLPWDPEFDATEGEVLPGPPPEDLNPELPSRIVLRPRGG